MNKIKIANKMGITQLIIKSLKGQQVNENEVYAINSNRVPGLLHLDVMQKGTSFKLIYNITGFVTLADYLRTPLNKQSFAGLLQNILANCKAMESSYFNLQYVLMDMNQVFINPNTQHIYFIYLPIQYFENQTSFREFLLGIIQHGTFAAGEDNSYVRDYINILNSGINFSVFELEEYVNRLLGQNVTNIQDVECPNCRAKVKKGTNYCNQCGSRIYGNTGGTGKGVYDPLADAEKEEKIPEAPPKEYIPETKKDNTQGLSDGTTVLGADPGGTTVLGSEELETPVYPYLIREKNNEKISVNKPSFRIGAERKYVDYWVSDNSTVSRSHADIITKDKRYYIIDLNSTNKTYVDNRAIAIQKEVELFNGTRIRLSNEDFVFYVES